MTSGLEHGVERTPQKNGAEQTLSEIHTMRGLLVDRHYLDSSVGLFCPYFIWPLDKKKFHETQKQFNETILPVSVLLSVFFL